jgi:hypothetical protein
MANAKLKIILAGVDAVGEIREVAVRIDRAGGENRFDLFEPRRDVPLSGNDAVSVSRKV